MQTQEDIFEFLFDKDEITWQTMLYELVRSEQMDPWDINISLLAQRFLEMLQKFKKMDFRISGKIILAAAILLKIKSNRLVNEDISNLDRLFSQQNEEDEQGLLDELIDDFRDEREILKDKTLIPRTPQPRKRKVSIYDLVDALQKAIEVKKRRVMRDIPSVEVKIPDKKRDISEIIKTIYGRIFGFFSSNKQEKLTFTKLIPSESREDKVFTFIPLLHLTNQRKIDLYQKQHFGEIEIQMLKRFQENDLKKDTELKSK